LDTDPETVNRVMGWDGEEPTSYSVTGGWQPNVARAILERAGLV
jgi:hypothetical protein